MQRESVTKIGPTRLVRGRAASLPPPSGGACRHLIGSLSYANVVSTLALSWRLAKLGWQRLASSPRAASDRLSYRSRTPQPLPRTIARRTSGPSRLQPGALLQVRTAAAHTNRCTHPAIARPEWTCRSPRHHAAHDKTAATLGAQVFGLSCPSGGELGRRFGLAFSDCAGGGGYIYGSTDAGARWTKRHVALLRRPSGDGAYFSSDATSSASAVLSM